MNLNEMIDGFVKIALDLGADIAPIENAFWIDELEKKLGKRYPASFYQFVLGVIKNSDNDAPPVRRQ